MEIAAGPSAEALAERIENEIKLVKVIKGEDARTALDALDRLYARLSTTYAHSNYKKIQRLIELIPCEMQFVDTLKAIGKNYAQICVELNSKQHSARTRDEATAISNNIQLESILKKTEESNNESAHFVQFSKSNYSRKADRRNDSGDEGGSDSGNDSGHNFKRQSHHLGLNKKSSNRNVEHYSTGRNSERTQNGFPSTFSHQQQSSSGRNNKFPKNDYYGSGSSNSNQNSRTDYRRDFSKVTCFNCRKLGHISTYCPDLHK